MVAASSYEPSALDTGLVPLDPRVRALWWSAAALVAVPIALAAAVTDAVVAHPLPPGMVTLVVAALAAGLAYAVPLLRYRRWRYALREHDLWLRSGVLWVTVSVIPYRRLQFVDTRQGPLDRLFGLSQLVVHTAALGTSGRLPGLDAAQAERLRDRLAARQADQAETDAAAL